MAVWTRNLKVRPLLARTMADLPCRQAADKPDGRLRPHYASPLTSSSSLSNADPVSRPYKIFAYPYFCACSLLSLCLAATAETCSTRASTTLLCTSTMKYLHDDNRRSVSPPRDYRTTQGWGRAWGSPCGARVRCLEKMGGWCTVHVFTCPHGRWWASTRVPH